MDKALSYRSESYVPTTSALQALKQYVSQNSIPAAEVEANQTTLRQAQEEDKKRHIAEVKGALVKYKKQHSCLKRFIYLMGRGFKRYQPDVAPITVSPETQLLEQVVALQDAVVKGYGLFKALPDVLQKMKSDYGKLAVRQGELETRIAEIEEDLCVLPERQREYTALFQRLENYNALPEQEQEKLSAELQTKTGVEILPPLENASVRSLLQRRLMDENQQLANDKLSSLLELLNIEYAFIRRQKRTIETQEHQLEHGWKPALIQLSRLKEQYDMLSRFTSGARLLIGMNELRKNTVEMIAQSEEAMTNAAAYIYNTRIEAEAHEESFAQPKNVRIFPEADIDEAIIIDVEGEPYMVERK